MSDTNSRTSNVLKNILTGVGGKVLLSVFVFVERRVFIRYIGIEYLGINGLFANILQLLSMADLGFSIAMGYSYYGPFARGNISKVAALTQFYAKIYNLISASIFVIGIILMPFLKYIINISGEIPHLYVYYILYLTNVSISYLFVYSTALMNADQKGYMVNTITVMVGVIKTVVQMAAIVICKSYLVYLSITIAATILNNILLFYKSKLLYPFMTHKKIRLDEKERNEIFLNLKSVFIYKISGTLLNSVDTILISVLVGTAIVGYYSNYQMIVLYITQFIGILFSAVTAGVGNFIHTESGERNYEVFQSMLFVSFWLSAVAFAGIYYLSSDFIFLWLGEEYILGGNVSMAIAFNLFFVISMQPVFVFREAIGLYQKTKWIMLIASGVNLALSIVLGKIWGLAGIIVATILARIVTYFWFEPHLLYKTVFNRGAVSFFVQYGKNMIITLGCILFLQKGLQIPVHGSVSVFLFKICMVVMFVSAVYWICNYKNPSFRWICSRFISIFHKKERP